MINYVIKRVLHMIPIIISVSIIVFMMLSFAPGDPARLILGNEATEEQLEEKREAMGFNDPLVIQYYSYAKELVKGNLGESYFSKQPVLKMISVRIGNTLKLAFGVITIIVLIEIPLGVMLAVKQNSAFDNAMRIISMIVASMPQFWLGLMMILAFAVNLKWLPATGFDSSKHIILPIFCGSAAGWATGSRLVRASMLDVIRQDYIRTARAKGLSEAVVMRKHALKNALMPTITSIGMAVGVSFGGAVVLEQLFGINGLGKMLIEAVRQKDIPVILGGVLVSTIVIAVTNLLTDLAYAVVDPRIRSMYVKPNKRKASKKVVANE